ncbi:rod shape-determining protein MreC [Lactococcus taiwanensis]|uniref:Cell shape-determining protein MreC n=1 Tax=Lactococcus taiwanensis TaxID=1151742 RepID=A0AA45KGK2_9LACT|nr:rod shape-determining protein MreC [Lactococcus taiwanensis]KZK36824.1 Rod shape-determining protein MreC [Lactococcus cremoris]QRZ10759.1 rod shape-determining protein MreC [Lactococcus taiwanensis]QSE76864.1 rod shape-determining protein MreC [Lactococcus taiwanensis]
MKKFNLSKLIIITLIIIIAAMSAIVISAKNFKSNREPSAMTQVINDGTSFVDRVLAAPIRFVQDKTNQLTDLMQTYKQNESLKTQVAKSKDDASKLNGLESENTELKKALKLQETLTDYQTVAANVITRNPTSWNDTLVIDSGSKDGLKTGMIVMANGGVIGRVTQVNKESSKVALLSSSKGIENKIPIRLGNGEESSYGLLTGYDSQQNAYIITQLTTQDKFDKDTQVYTSGLGGGDSPRDLLVGTVIGEKDDKQGLNRQIYVKPASNLYDIRFVFVVERMIGGN